jgi:GT2 family glycosyltransferase
MAKSTVVIPNFNGIKYIEACLESVYAGTIKNVEVIVVDNASTDGSMELVRDKFPQVELIVNSENTGFSHAVNQGIRLSSTPYVILLNNDTRVELDFVNELEKIMDKDKFKKIFSASAKMVSLHDKDKIDDAGDYYCALGWPFARGKGKTPDSYNNDCNIFSACAGAAIYRRELFEEDKVGLFDEEHFAYFEDIDVGYRALLKGYRNVFASKAVVYHAGSSTSGSRYNTFKTKLSSRNSIYIIYKNMPVWQVVINLPFLALGFLIKTLFFIKKGMGRDYITGLINGFKLSASNNGRQHKQKFTLKTVPRCLYVQILLFVNMFRLFG